jgi:hypothetical protein
MFGLNFPFYPCGVEHEIYCIKNISFQFDNSCYASKRTPLWSLYVFLSLISVIGAAGGLNSLLTKNQTEEILTSSQYQTLEQQIQEKQNLLKTTRQLADENLQYHYRTKAQEIITTQIPSIENQLVVLQEAASHLHTVTPSGATLAINMLPVLNHFSENKSQAIFVMILALLIDIISAFFISLSFLKSREGFREDSPQEISPREISLLNNRLKKSFSEYSSAEEGVLENIFEAGEDSFSTEKNDFLPQEDFLEAGEGASRILENILGAGEDSLVSENIHEKHKSFSDLKNTSEEKKEILLGNQANWRVQNSIKITKKEEGLFTQQKFLQKQKVALFDQGTQKQSEKHIFLSDKYQRILDNIAKKIYEPKVTQIMKYEKIGYKQAKCILGMLNATSEDPCLKYYHKVGVS